MWFRLSVFNFVECAVWRLMLVVFVVCVGGRWCCELLCSVCACECRICGAKCILMGVN